METNITEIAVKRFLSNGNLGKADPVAMASACDKAIQKCARTSIKSALLMARRFEKQSSSLGKEVRLTASRMLARYLHMTGNHRDALQAYSQARTLARRQPLIRARIDRALTDVQMYLGHFEEARRAARAAIRTFERMDARNDLVQTRVNLANLLHRQDRHAEAEKLYSEAADYFMTSDNMLAAARCHYNRANTLVQLFEWSEAEKLYESAIEIYTDEGFELDANDARYGLAWLRMLSGEFHSALLDLATCEKIYAGGGDPRGEALCKLDRAETFVSLGLYPDARESAAAAERMFSKLGLRYESSKASLFRAKAAMALNSKAEALRACKRASDGFKAEKNRGFLGATYVVESDLQLDNKSARLSSLKKARSIFSRTQSPAWRAICDLKLAMSASRNDAAFSRLAANPAVRQIPHLYALWQTTLGDRMIRDGKPGRARRHWTNAAQRLDDIRAKLPPFELRSSYGSAQDSPHIRLIELESEDNPRDAAIWTEKYKTAGVWAPLPSSQESHPLRERVLTSLDRLAQRVTALAYRIDNTSLERCASGAASGPSLSKLQAHVREAMIAAEQKSKSSERDVGWIDDYLTDVSQTIPIVQFHVQKRDIIAFVHSGGDTSVVRYDGGRKRLSELMCRWRFIVENDLMADYFGEKSDPSLEHAFCRDVGDWLWKPLEIESAKKQVLIIPEGELANIPWQALIDDGRHLSDMHSFVLSPSITHFRAASRVRTDSQAVEIFQGVSDDLEHAKEELESVSRHFPGNSTLHSPGLRKDWPSDGGYRFWHFAGHAALRSDNPFYSYLAFDDGPLFAADFRLKNCRVMLASLAACRSGQQIALPGEEATGLVRSLLEMGARNVLASHWPVSDRSSRIWMDEFYGRISNGDSLLAAVDKACGKVRETEPSAYHWAAYSIFGAGDLGE